MIIFDLDGTLADCEHRRHFVDPSKNENFFRYNGNDFRAYKNGKPNLDIKWKPDYEAFYEACDEDSPIYPTLDLINIFILRDYDVQIWTGRSYSVKDKTIVWLRDYLDVDQWFYRDCIKMRPIGDSTPDDQLKMSWLDEAISEGKTVEFVFDDRPKVVRAWRRRGIFVFNCCQHDQEF